MTTVYRIFDDIDEQPHSLFHGTKGSRKLPLDEWITADTKPVKDGTGGKLYQSGFHVFQSLPYAYWFFVRHFRITETRVISKVEIDLGSPLYKKPGKNDVWLAKEILIPFWHWNDRIYLRSYGDFYCIGSR